MMRKCTACGELKSHMAFRRTRAGNPEGKCRRCRNRDQYEAKQSRLGIGRRQCEKCGVAKSVRDFHKDGDRLTKRCKLCMNRYKRAHRHCRSSSGVYVEDSGPSLSDLERADTRAQSVIDEAWARLREDREAAQQ